MVSAEQAEDRLDFRYHAQRVAFSSIYRARTRRLSDITQVLTRGCFTSAEVKNSDYPVLHTTDIPEELCGCWCDISSFGKSQPAGGGRFAIAEPGDVLVARVGRNLERKVIGVAKGYARLSDCVYKIRVAEAHRELLLKRLGSESGRVWLASQAYGVSAKQLTKSSLLAFPF
jgi:type I restriction enzyme M protein